MRLRTLFAAGVAGVMLLSGCTAEITPLGSKSGGGTVTVTTATDSHCVIGPPNEQKEY